MPKVLSVLLMQTKNAGYQGQVEVGTIHTIGSQPPKKGSSNTVIAEKKILRRSNK